MVAGAAKVDGFVGRSARTHLFIYACRKRTWQAHNWRIQKLDDADAKVIVVLPIGITIKSGL